MWVVGACAVVALALVLTAYVLEKRRQAEEERQKQQEEAEDSEALLGEPLQ